ncbi:MAG: ATP-binding protein [Deltaproteobacteria bacterium]|nr:ATP-binding protein [Deltaproteobacteria bacterium]
MKNSVALEITIPNQTRYLSLIGKIGENMAQGLANYNGDRERLASQINTVLTEALVNAIRHANSADPSKEILVRINMSDKELAIRVFDSGKGFDLNNVPGPCFNQDILDEKGRGLFIIRSLMDSVVYKKANGGNVLEMKKSLRLPRGKHGS